MFNTDMRLLEAHLPRWVILLFYPALILLHLSKAAFGLLGLVAAVLHVTGWAPYGWALNGMLIAIGVNLFIILLALPFYAYSLWRI
mgnify:FL=1